VLLPLRVGTSRPRLSSTASWRQRMEQFALVIAFALLATVSASAAEIPTTAPATQASNSYR
jgi:hypothetical protein